MLPRFAHRYVGAVRLVILSRSKLVCVDALNIARS